VLAEGRGVEFVLKIGRKIASLELVKLPFLANLATPDRGRALEAFRSGGPSQTQRFKYVLLVLPPVNTLVVHRTSDGHNTQLVLTCSIVLE
jgi:hypothetical protein